MVESEIAPEMAPKDLLTSSATSTPLPKCQGSTAEPVPTLGPSTPSFVPLETISVVFETVGYWHQYRLAYAGDKSTVEKPYEIPRIKNQVAGLRSTLQDCLDSRT